MAEPIERLSDYLVLVDWAIQAGVISSAEREKLITISQARAARILGTAIALRELLFEAIDALVAGKRLPERTLQNLNAWIAHASRRRRLVRNGASLAWSRDAGEPDAILWQIVESAASTFASDDLRGRLRICGGPTCAWVFLDFSRKQNRRWCDMSVCGNRAKVRRHYERSRAPTQRRRGKSSDLAAKARATRLDDRGKKRHGDQQ